MSVKTTLAGNRGRGVLWAAVLCLLILNLFAPFARSDANRPEDRAKRCVGVAAVRDENQGMTYIFRAFEDGEVETETTSGSVHWSPRK